MCLLPFCNSAGKIPSSPGDLYVDIVLNAHFIRSSVTISEAYIPTGGRYPLLLPKFGVTHAQGLILLSVF